MARKRRSKKAASIKLPRNKAAVNRFQSGVPMMAPSPLMSHGKPVVVKDLLGSFSEQTGASFG